MESRDEKMKRKMKKGIGITDFRNYVTGTFVSLGPNSVWLSRSLSRPYTISRTKPLKLG